jgi:hypothetical protein
MHAARLGARARGWGPAQGNPRSATWVGLGSWGVGLAWTPPGPPSGPVSRPIREGNSKYTVQPIGTQSGHDS